MDIKVKGRIAALAGGFVLDALLGDPHGWPHLVRLVGKQIEAAEGFARTRLVEALQGADSPVALDRSQAERLSGAVVVADVALTAPICAALALKACERVHPALRVAAESALFYQLLAARALRDESMAVQRKLEAHDLEGAREAVGMIVGRDTDALDEQGVARAAVETVAENASDGVVAPLLFMGIGGAPAAMFYKAVNTLDSMLGYKNDKYRDFGWAAAKLDDAVNIVPARVSGALMCAAAKLAGMDGEGAWRIFVRDRYNHASPNSAHSEAACAGALGVQLGGPSAYFGKMVDKPTIGDATRPVEAADIQRANRLMYVTAGLGLGLAMLTAARSRRVVRHRLG